ncbi:cell division protein ZapA [Gottfriedia luciferensis]|uniref:cell division protein ZapA n=1 Tax=Gottfriedia luciferensis TaxID=178774 RepID=UPI001EEA04A3|nr:cell division protein ZapA [Gottfriedia luciferensis]
MSNSSSKQKLNVTIYGQHYSITGDESTEHIRRVASIVDEKMKEINHKNPFLDTNKLAVLTAINIVSDYLKLQERAELLEKLLLEKETKSEKNNDD